MADIVFANALDTSSISGWSIFGFQSQLFFIIFANVLA